MERTIDGRFTLLGRREAGKGFSCHLAHHHRLGTQVLVDLLGEEVLGGYRAAPGVAGSEGLPALLDRLACMRHPFLSRVLAWGMDGGELFVVRQFDNGRSLQELLEELGGLPLRQAKEVLKGLVDALGYLHGKGLFYLGINPRQIHVDIKGRARLIRPGYAWVLEAADPVISREVAPYLAPEVLGGREGTRSSDVYSLGVMAGRLLLPWAQENIAVRRVIKEAVTEEAEKRPPSARVFMERLEEALDGKAGGMRVPTPLPRGSAGSIPEGGVSCRKEDAREVSELSPAAAAGPGAKGSRLPLTASSLDKGNSATSSAHPKGGVEDPFGEPFSRLRMLAGGLNPDMAAGGERRRRAVLRKPALAAAACALAALLLLAAVRAKVPVDKERQASPQTSRGLVRAVEDEGLRGPWLTVPDLRGVGGEEALRLLQGMGLRVEVAVEPSRTVPRGKVIIQEPPQGEALRPDTRVRLLVSGGPLGGEGGPGVEAGRSSGGAGGQPEAPSPEGGEGDRDGASSMLRPARDRFEGGTAKAFTADGGPGRSEAEAEPDGQGSPGRDGRAA